MEENLDTVAEGGKDWLELMQQFTGDFNPTLAAASKNMKSVKQGLPCNLTCPACGKDLLIKFGKAGAFLACSSYPECNFTSDFIRKDDGSIEIVERVKPEAVGECPECGSDLVIKKARSGGQFIGCSGFPKCTYTRPLPTGVSCPECGQGELVERRSKRGKLFYSCSTYPKCTFAIWDRPIAEACPQCGSPYLVEKKSKNKTIIKCPNAQCHFVKESDEASL